MTVFSWLLHNLYPSFVVSLLNPQHFSISPLFPVCTKISVHTWALALFSWLPIWNNCVISYNLLFFLNLAFVLSQLVCLWYMKSFTPCYSYLFCFKFIQLYRVIIWHTIRIVLYKKFPVIVMPSFFFLNTKLLIEATKHAVLMDGWMDLKIKCVYRKENYCSRYGVRNIFT